MPRDDVAENHKIWLGMVQPVGLVVSPPALAAKQAILSDNVIKEQQFLAAKVKHHEKGARFEGNFAQFAAEVLEWPAKAIRNDEAALQKHELVLTDYDVTLRPDYAIHDDMGDKALLMLVRELPPEADLDAKDENAAWHASHHDKFERLLRDAEVSTGLIFNGRELRLIYAPRGETSGHATFKIGPMVEVAGRPILGALLLLLGDNRVFGAADGQRLPDLLSESRRYQTTVSTLLAEQVLDALWDMLRGFAAADELAQHKLIGPDAGIKPEEVYGGLLASLLRLVFLLYAEDQGLMPDDPVYQQNYAVSGLFTRLRDDAAKYPDTMDQRYGAWGWL
ncbi:MAG: class I SAM-dependent DNA methyltransferase, partial [Planctomycetes bacterium]|nr:class I SAM-dependent DNA methyltransferase [Planctomycetota bacterium]